MTIVIPFKSKAKADLKAVMAKEKSSAKTASVPPTKKEKITAALKARFWSKWEGPDKLMLCRLLAGGDLRAGLLLFRIVELWKMRKGRLDWAGREWLAMSSKAWANQAGLTDSEFRNYALPRMRRTCHEFVSVRQKKLGEKKVLWISVDWIGFAEAVKAEPWEVSVDLLNGLGIGGAPPKGSAYSKAV